MNRPPHFVFRCERIGPLKMAALAFVAVCASACTRSVSETAIGPEAAPTFIVTGPADLPPGTHVRYHTRGQRFGHHTARVAEATADTLWLRHRDIWGRKTRRAVAIARLRDLAFTRTDYPKEDRAGVAMTAGAIVSVILALSVPPNTDSEAAEGVLELYSALLGSLLTGIAYAIVAPGDEYEPVPLPGSHR